MALVAFFYRPSASASALHAILQLTANSQEKGARIHKGMGQSPWAPFVVADGNRLDIPSIIRLINMDYRIKINIFGYFIVCLNDYTGTQPKVSMNHY